VIAPDGAWFSPARGIRIRSGLPVQQFAVIPHGVGVLAPEAKALPQNFTTSCNVLRARQITWAQSKGRRRNTGQLSLDSRTPNSKGMRFLP
jgi:hypothetical protein